jgi:high-affinity iron transporter
MVTSFLLSLREGLEAALIIGIVLVVEQNGTPESQFNRLDWCFLRRLVSIFTVIGMIWVRAEFEGQGEQLFEGITMLLTAGVLTWMVFWMGKQLITMRQNIEISVCQVAQGQGKRVLSFLAFLIVVREKIEPAHFYWPLA